MSDATKKQCAHPACSCTVTDKDRYCSEYCRDAKDITELTCSCNHPGCR